jgi:RimJ/RimL family protein N-acetyltransferase
MIFAQTPRLTLRALEIFDLPRVTELIGDWDVARWLVLVPYPYHLKDAEEFFEKQNTHYAVGKPQFFAIADRKSNCVLGGVG